VTRKREEEEERSNTWVNMTMCVCVPAPCVQPLLGNVLPTTHFILEAAASSTSAPVWAVVMEFEQVPHFGFLGAWQERKCKSSERAAEVLGAALREKACALKRAGGEEDVDAGRQERLDLSKARMKLCSLGYTEEEVDAFVFAATSYRAAPRHTEEQIDACAASATAPNLAVGTVDSGVTADESKEVALEAFLSGMRSVACKRRRLELRRRYVVEKKQDNGTEFNCIV